MKLVKAKLYVARRRLLLARGVQRHTALGIGYDKGPMPHTSGRLQIQLRPVSEEDERAAIARHRRLDGTVDIVALAADESLGAWSTEVDDDNLVVLLAEQLMAQMSIQSANSGLNYIELGDPAAPATPPQISDLTLQQTTGQRKAAILTVSGNIATAEVLFGTSEANGFTYTEAGLFTGPFAAGGMFARKVFAGIAKSSGFQMRFVWNVTFLIQTQGGDCAGVSLIGPNSVTAFTVAAPAVGGEASIAATFDFSVGANNVDVFLDRQRLYPSVHYNEAAAGSLNAPVLGPAGNKGVNLIGFTLNPTEEVLLIQRTLA